MAKHKLQFFLDHIFEDFTIPTRFKLVFNLIIRLGLSVSEIVDLKLFHVNISSDLLEIIISSKKKNKVALISVKRSKQTSHLFDLINEYFSERKKLTSKYDNLFLGKRLTPFNRDVICKSLQRYKGDIDIGEYTTETMRFSSLNILASRTIAQVRLIEKEHLKKLEKEIAEKVKSAPVEIYKSNLIEREKEVSVIKKLINKINEEGDFGSGLGGNSCIISAPLGGGKTSLVQFAEMYAKQRKIYAIKKTFYKGHKNFGVFHEICEELGRERIDFTKREIFFERVASVVTTPPGAEKFSKIFPHREGWLPQQPLILIFEDIHNADLDSLEFLRYLLKSLSIKYNQKIVLFLTIDDKEEYSWILKKIEVGNLNKVNLYPLSSRGILSLSRQFFKNKNISNKLLKNIEEISAGNPHFITQILKYFKKNERRILRIKNKKIYCSSWDIPEKIQDIENKRIKKSDYILLVLSEFTRPIKKEIVLNIAKRLSKSSILSAFTSLKRKKLLIEKKGLISFYHETLREAVKIPEQEQNKIKKNIIDELKYNLEELAYHLDRMGKSSFDIYEKAAKYFFNIGSLNASLYYFNKAQRSGKISKKQIIEILRYKQRIYTELRQWDKGIESAKKIQILLKDDQEKNDIFISLGDIYFKKGDYEQSSINYDKAKEKILSPSPQPLSPRGEGEASLALIYLKIAKILNKKANYIEAAKISSKGQKILAPLLSFLRTQESRNNGGILGSRFRGNDSEGVYANLLTELGLAYMYLGQYKKAQNVLDTALKTAKENKSKTLTINSLIMLGMVQHYLADYKKAVSFYDEAREIAEMECNRYLEGMALMNIGASYHMDGNLGGAIKNYDKAEHIFDLLSKDFEKTDMLVKLAIIYASFGNFTQAFACAKEALETSEKNNYKLFIPSMEHLIGSVKKNLGDTVSAMSFFDKALFHFSELERIYESCFVLLSQAEIYSDFNKFREAKEKTRLAINLGFKNNFKDVVYRGYLMQAQIEIEGGAKQNEKIDEFLNKAGAVSDFEPLHDYRLQEKWLRAYYYKIVGKNKESEAILKETKESIFEFSKSVPDDFKKVYVKSREHYFALPRISVADSSEDFVSEFTAQKALLKRSSQIFESIAIKDDPISLLREAIQNLIQIKHASCAILNTVDNDQVKPMLSIDKRGRNISDDNIFPFAVEYVLKTGLPYSSDDYLENPASIWQCFPIKSFNKTCGILFFVFDEEISKLSEGEEMIFKNLLAVMGMIVERIM